MNQVTMNGGLNAAKGLESKHILELESPFLVDMLNEKVSLII